MAFDDLPPNWTDLPLSTPQLADDVVDLVLKEPDRARNTMALLPCDEHDVAYPTPVLIDGIDWCVDAEERREMLAALTALELPAVVCAVSSAQRLPEELVECWRADVETAFGAAGTRVIGFFSAWAHHVQPAPRPV